MEINLIKTDEELQIALKRFSKIFHAKKDTPEREEADLLSLVIAKYEEENYAIDEPDPIEAIKFMMQQKDLKQVDLAKILKIGEDRISKIIHKKEALTLPMIREISKLLHIPLLTLVQDYKLIKKASLTKVQNLKNNLNPEQSQSIPKKGFRQAKKVKNKSKLKHA
jgi:HTH-type transcriptional regulator/antitoxin HigA